MYSLPRLSGAPAPPNTLIWVINAAETATFALHDVNGSPIPVTATRVISLDAELVVLTPERLLTPGTRYQVVTVAADQTTTSLNEFDVIGDRDDVPPPLPELVDVEPVVSEGSTCGSFRGLGLSVQGEGLGVMRVASSEAGAFEVDPPTGAVAKIALENGGSFDFDLVTGGCGYSWPSSHEQIDAQLASFDLAGNFSGWSDAETLRLPSEAQGCAVREPGRRTRAASSAALIGMLVGIAWRRRLPARRLRLCATRTTAMPSTTTP